MWMREAKLPFTSTTTHLNLSVIQGSYALISASSDSQKLLSDEMGLSSVKMTPFVVACASGGSASNFGKQSFPLQAM